MCCIYFLNRLFFLEQLYIYGKKAEGTESSHIPPSSVSPVINILLWWGTFVTLDEPTLIHYY